MRKLKLQVQMSIDGYIADANNKMDWMVWDWDDELKQYIADITDPVDCILLGRKLAQEFIPYWASVPNEEGAEKINKTPKIVFTRTLTKSEWPDTRLATGDLVEEINALKKQTGNDMIVYGGGGFVSSLIKHGLIDDLHLLVNPTAVGDGMAIFQTLDHMQAMILEKSQAFRCGIVALHYTLKQPSQS